jgi:hypothetical protein
MGQLVNGAKRTTRKSRLPAAGRHLVLGLKKRGFDAQLGLREHEMLVRTCSSLPTPVRVKTAHVTRWYDRRASFVGRLANQVTVFVLIGLEGNSKSVRFFVVKNGDLLVHFRSTENLEGTHKQTDKKVYGYIDSKSVEKYEDNWVILR